MKHSIHPDPTMPPKRKPTSITPAATPRANARDLAERCLAPTPTLRSLADACAARVREQIADQSADTPRAEARSHLLAAAKQLRLAAIAGVVLGAITQDQARELDAIVAGLRDRAMGTEEPSR